MNATNLLQQADALPWYWYVILVLVVLMLVVWWLFWQIRQMERKARSGEPLIPETGGREAELTREDDLTKLEGIGPKVAKVLSEAGITSFEALSRADPAEVKNVLNQAGLQMMDPEGWIEQAHLAAQEDWEGLEKLQDELKGGRRK